MKGDHTPDPRAFSEPVSRYESQKVGCTAKFDRERDNGRVDRQEPRSGQRRQRHVDHHAASVSLASSMSS